MEQFNGAPGTAKSDRGISHQFITGVYKMLQVTQITRVDGVPMATKFNNGVTRYYDTKRGEWIASERETALILKALQ